MNDEIEKTESKIQEEFEKPVCSCMSDPFSNLPPELRPHPKDVLSGLCKVTCPVCGFDYWTNRNTDICIDCEKKGVKPLNTNIEAVGEPC
jgi:hypothetical protein